MKFSLFFKITLSFSGSFVYSKKEWINLPLPSIIQLFIKNTEHFITYIAYDIPITWVSLIFFGLSSQRLQLYLHNKTNVTIRGFVTDEPTLIKKMRNIHKRDAYILLGEEEEPDLLKSNISLIFDEKDI